MKIYFHSQSANSTGLALKCSSAGHQVKMFISEEGARSRGQGYIESLEAISKIVVEKPDALIFDSPGYSALSDRLGKYGIKTLCSTRLEQLDSSTVAKSLGLRIAEPGIKGVEVESEVWFQNGKPLYPRLIIIKTKKFLAGDLGIETPCQTSFVIPCEIKEPRIIQEHKKFWYMIEKAGYTGPATMTSIVSGKRIYFKEFRFGLNFNSVYAFWELLENSNDFIPHLANGFLRGLPVKKMFGYAVNITTPPYPYFMHYVTETEVSLTDNLLCELYHRNTRKVGDKFQIVTMDRLAFTAAVADKNVGIIEKKINSVKSGVILKDLQYRVDGVQVGYEIYLKLKSKRLI